IGIVRCAATGRAIGGTAATSTSTGGSRSTTTATSGAATTAGAEALAAITVAGQVRRDAIHDRAARVGDCRAQQGPDHAGRRARAGGRCTLLQVVGEQEIGAAKGRDEHPAMLHKVADVE